jgi:hypothetical protein
MPITHREPDDAAKAVEIPPVTKRHLGLDDQRSWVMVNEGNQFVWPGYHLRKVPGRDKYDYGFRPPKLFQSVLSKARAWLNQHALQVTTR